MFLSTINRLREEQIKDNSLRVCGGGNVTKSKILNIGEKTGGRGICKEINKCASKTCKKFNGGRNRPTNVNNDNELKISNISQKKFLNKIGNANKEKISSFQQILNIATSSNGIQILDRKPIKNTEFHLNQLIPSSSYYDSLPGSPNSDYKSDDQRSRKESNQAIEDTDDEGDSPPKINFVRIICSGKGSESGISNINKTVSSKNDRKKDKENNNKNFKLIKRLKCNDLDNTQNFRSASKPLKAKKTTKKDDEQTGKVSGQVLDNEENKNNDEYKSQDSGQSKENLKKKKAIEAKVKKPENTILKDIEEKGNSKPKNSHFDSEEKSETYKQNILTLKAKNNLIKKRFKDQTDDDFFNNILVSTPTNSSSRKTRKSLNLELSPNLSIFSPDTLDIKLLKTGLTPVNSNREEPASSVPNNKAYKRKELKRKGLGSFHLSPLSSCLKEIASGEDTNRNSSYSKSSASKSLGDILGSLENNTGSKSGKLGKLSCEKQNKFVMQIHEKLTNRSSNDESELEKNPYSQIKKKSGITTDKLKVTKGSLDLKINLDSMLDQEMEINTRIANQEKQQELLWSITEDLSIQNEDRNLLMEELIAHTTQQN
ncbi:uncharacterized protein cubi_03473 [Cryptosporidium ubiquitum]|uniref:Uncharacterized protein n=1 Tax=Cryptosporidium ubiquitum TaxID=857276 RepID=A0A1J4MJP0_9CRYT|nr:uncharacterized protein cubi_03473 [Cryptosporidium ubiquitum]OII73675.1 hypothetical protein cubi_03473 [Cryptosporidium ubiquitum]